VTIFDEIEKFDDLCSTKPPIFDCVSIKDPDLDYAKVKFVAPGPPSITKNKPYAINKGSTSDYCRFARVLMSLPPMDGITYDFDLGVEFGGGPSDRVHYQIILYADCAIWCYLMMKKDLHHDFLRWYLLLQEFNFVVHDNSDSGNVGRAN